MYIMAALQPKPPSTVVDDSTYQVAALQPKPPSTVVDNNTYTVADQRMVLLSVVVVIMA
jgi:hypothetical protein